MGQTSSDFLQANHKRNFELVRTSTEWTVYKWQNNWSYTEQPYFFYFHNDQLYKVDRGMSPSDIVIEHRY
ncbi:hypothetical protein [Mucilaginibacter sp. KACC 22063]|uniref:hypothetical protein n=1 Tax=Mucilaginibacter sp. KACC 22063 TaxID=3025666 RepID=UPI002365A182|nr:hypothetical protein [Mucilaginibacter sp. KACC 22063]WDF54892.1 hypothetical protein PQ461_18340 [Mucilaginibacter sp. KACC 22063]